MKRLFTVCFYLFAVTSCSTEEPEVQIQLDDRDRRPNFLLILADDLGFSDLGAYGGEISTPNLDALAQQGVQMLNFHSAPTCGPARGMLMTGIDSHRVGTGANAAALQRLPELQGRPGYEGYLNQDVATLPERLSLLGYQSFMVGKWDLGASDIARPAQRGFDRSFALIESGGSHFADMAGNFSFESRVHYYEDDVLVESLPEDFYSTNFFTDKLVSYLDHADGDRPWFGYAAYSAPHWPLQVPEGTPLPQGYEVGWTEIARQRLNRQIEMGLIPAGAEVNDHSGAWEALHDEQRQVETRQMRLYASMVEILDEQIGSLLTHARAVSGDRPLVVLFLSDNGPEGNHIGRIGDTQSYIEERFDLSYENMGQPGSYSWAGQRWAEVSATPLSLFKSFVSEGGTRVPAIFSVPGLQGESAQLASVMDVVPTLVHLAGGDVGDQPELFERLPVQGVSLAPALQSPHLPFDRPPLGFELYGNRALISGNYKARLVWPPAGSGEWQLFDLSTDPFEQRDLSQQLPEVMAQLEQQWWHYAETNGVYVFDLDNGYGRYEEY